MSWLVENCKWIFSGIGVAVIGWIIYRVTHKVNQNVKESKNVMQIGGDVNIGKANDKSKRN